MRAGASAGQGSSLYVLAHQDDEYGCAAQISRDAASGRTIAVIFLTDGSTPAVSESVRTVESRAVLSSLGVAAADVHVVGAGLQIPSEALPERIDDAYRGLRELVQSLELRSPLRIYAPAWEGGHPDHDATHLAAARLARELGVEQMCEVALYNGFRRPGPFFRVLSFCDGARVGPESGPPLSIREAIRYALLCLRYTSQRRTWLGLFPGAFARLVTRRRHAIRLVSTDRPIRRPHEGSLYYERRWGFPYERFVALTARFAPMEERAAAQ
jgi:hypothetical protein